MNPPVRRSGRLNSNALRPVGWTSADAAGLPILPGLVRYDEVAAGVIAHALRFTVSRTQKAYVLPARHWASSDVSSLRPPMGMRVRLKASYDLSSYPPSAQVSRWNDAELNTLKRLRGSDFEVVRLTGLVKP